MSIYTRAASKRAFNQYQNEPIQPIGKDNFEMVHGIYVLK